MDSSYSFEIGGKTYDLENRSLIAGILNRTKDSFYDKGAFYDFDKFLIHADSLVKDGADILDIGGVKAGSGSPISEAEELERVIPAVESIKKRFDVIISVDTWNANVIREAFSKGALIGNDISGFSDPQYLVAAKDYDASVVLTHIRLRPRVDDPNPVYNDLIKDITEFFKAKLLEVDSVKIPRNKVVIDLGLDLGKTSEQSLMLLRNSAKFQRELKRPIYLSISMKGCLGELLNLEVNQRGPATISAITYGALNGCRIMRVHDVKAAKQALAIIDNLREFYN